MDITPMPVEYIHTPTNPDSMPHGWGIAYKYFERKYNDLPGQIDEAEIPSNEEFWTNEVAKLEANLKVVIESKDSKKIDRALDQLFVAKNRLKKETAQ